MAYLFKLLSNFERFPYCRIFSSPRQIVFLHKIYALSDNAYERPDWFVLGFQRKLITSEGKKIHIWV